MMPTNRGSALSSRRFNCDYEHLLLLFKPLCWPLAHCLSNGKQLMSYDAGGDADAGIEMQTAEDGNSHTIESMHRCRGYSTTFAYSSYQARLFIR